MPAQKGLRREGLACQRFVQNPNAPWIVLLPGAGAAAAVWRRQIPSFRKVCNLLVIDLPGHGRSPRGEPTEQYSFESIAELIVETLGREGIERAHFVSMSLGALVCEAVTLTYPGRIKSVVQAGGIARLSWWATTLMQIGRAASSFLPYIALYQLFAWIIMPGPRHASTRRLFASHAVRLGEEEFQRWYGMTKSVKQLQLRAAERQTFIPTLFVMGDGDYMFKQFARERERSRVDTRVVIIANCGHVCSVEQPEQFNNIVLRFIVDCEQNTGSLSQPNPPQTLRFQL